MSNIVLPKIDQSIIERKKNIFSKLKKLTAPENFLSHESEIKPYETDALAAYKQTPLGVILPESTEEVSNILKFVIKKILKLFQEVLELVCQEERYLFKMLFLLVLQNLIKF